MISTLTNKDQENKIGAFFQIKKSYETIYYASLSILQFNYLISQLAKNIAKNSEYENLSYLEKQFLNEAI